MDPSGAVRDQVIAGVQPGGSWAVHLTLPSVAVTTTFRVTANCRVYPEARAAYAIYNEATVDAVATPPTTTVPTTAPPMTSPAAPQTPVPVEQLPEAAVATPVTRQPNYTG